MKVIFAGTPEFAASALKQILAAGHQVVLVLTQPDRPAGRGQKLQASPVKQVALSHGIPLHQPERLKDPLTHLPLKDADADVMVVAAYGLILPQTVLDIPPFGCLNIHASLLPRWRGAAPIHRAIEAGDRESGITIMQMDAGLDTGPMLLRGALPIANDETSGHLHDRLADLGGTLICEALARLPALEAIPQPDDGVTYAAKIEKKEAAIPWALPAEVILRRIRAFDPFPGAVTTLNGEVLKIWQAVEDRAVATAERPMPGAILTVDGSGILVACGQGTLRILSVQKAGGKRIPVSQFLQGTPLSAGTVLGH